MRQIWSYKRSLDMPGHEYVSMHDINLPMSQPRSAQRSQQLQLSDKRDGLGQSETVTMMTWLQSCCSSFLGSWRIYKVFPFPKINEACWFSTQSPVSALLTPRLLDPSHRILMEHNNTYSLVKVLQHGLPLLAPKPPVSILVVKEKSHGSFLVHSTQ